MCIRDRFEPVFAVIHDTAHRRRGCRRDLDEVKIFVVGHLLSVARRHDPQLLAVGADNADFAVSDLLVDLQFLTCYG